MRFPAAGGDANSTDTGLADALAHPKRAAQTPDRVAQVAARVSFTRIRPEEAGEAFPPMGRAGEQDEIGEQRLRRPGGDIHGGVIQAHVELAQEANA